MRSLGFLALLGVLGGVAGGLWGLSSGCVARGTGNAGPLGAHPIAESYRDTAHRIIVAALADDGAYSKLAYLTDRIGHRLSGSGALDEAIAWAQREMTTDGHENVRAEKVMVPHWVRGEERGEITAPVARPLSLLALGNSAGTPTDGIEADAVIIRDFDALDALGPTGVAGKIVVFNHPMPQFGPAGAKYDEAVVYRNEGPERAAILGAAAVLVRSVTARTLRTPHTGNTGFRKHAAIPAAAVSIEDAELLARLSASGSRVRIRLRLGSHQLEDVPSANVIGELRGRELPDEYVLVGAHIDSWDVGQGAHDDGAGVAAAMQALTTLRKLGLRPRRTIRVVLFTNEENGARGARAYAADHHEELARHVAALEMDTGAFAPRGYLVHGGGLPQMVDIAGLLNELGAGTASLGFAGTDVNDLTGSGVPTLGLLVDESTYFDYHHSQADTLDKVDRVFLAQDVAALAVVSFVLADMPARLSP